MYYGNPVFSVLRILSKYTACVAKCTLNVKGESMDKKVECFLSVSFSLMSLDSFSCCRC